MLTGLEVGYSSPWPESVGSQAVNRCHEAKCTDREWALSFDMPERIEHPEGEQHPEGEAAGPPPGRTRIGFALVPVKASKHATDVRIASSAEGRPGCRQASISSPNSWNWQTVLVWISFP